ncbi:MAG: glucokinase [Solirubrobacterales bacterium]|nr:glucokinase [Solirubrobacterales bacterium]
MSSAEAIGVDLGGTKMLVGVVDSERNIHHESSETSHGRSQEDLLAALAAELQAAREARPGVLAAGLGVPCTIDRARGVAIQAVNLPIEDVPLRELMSERLGLPVFIDNDANVAALAEHRFGAARGARNAVMLTVGTGVGGGLIIDGEPYRGSTGAGAELGHIVIDFDGPSCQGSCPSHGCVEALASGTALAKEGLAAAEREPGSALGRLLAAGEHIGGRAITTAARDGDAVAVEVVALIGRRLGVALASFANVFDPDVIVIGGGVTAGAGELLLEPARAELRARALPPMNSTKVLAAELGPKAGMIGAAAMALAELGAPV